MATAAPPRQPRDARRVPASPSGRHQERPRWRDTRLLVGVVLVLLSVLAGARLVAGTDATSPWLTVRTALPAGHVLTDADLAPVDVRLDDASSSRYFRASSRQALLGRALTAPVPAGTLLPADAVTAGAAPASRVVPVVVAAGRLPALRPGDRVDVYALVTGAQPGADREVLVVAGVEYLGGEVLGSGATAAQLRVAVADAIRVVAASRSERVDLVRVDGPLPAGPEGIPTEAPGLGG